MDDPSVNLSPGWSFQTPDAGDYHQLEVMSQSWVDNARLSKFEACHQLPTRWCPPVISSFIDVYRP